MKDLYLLKLGGSIITDVSKAHVAREHVIRRIFGEIRRSLASRDFTLIIGHGSGSFAHIPAKKYRVNEGLRYSYSMKGAAVTHQTAKELNLKVNKIAIESGLNALPFSPLNFALGDRGRIKTGDISQISEALKRGFIPITHGDVVIDLDRGVSIASTEEIFRYLSGRLRPEKILLATDVDGVFTREPSCKDAELIRFVGSRNIGNVLSAAGSSAKVDVTGGMKTKITLLYEMCRQSSCEGIIFNGNVKGNIMKALSGSGPENATRVKV